MDNSQMIFEFVATGWTWHRSHGRFAYDTNQSNLTLVVVKFYNGLRNVYCHERIRILWRRTLGEILVSVLRTLLRFVDTLRRSHGTVRYLQIPLNCSIQKHQQNFHFKPRCKKKLIMFASFIQRLQVFLKWPTN